MSKTKKATETPTIVRNVSIADFCAKHSACRSGVLWAKKNCPTGMMSEAYEKLIDAANGQNEEDGFFWWVASRAFDERQLRLLAVRFVRQTPLADGRRVQDLLTDQRSLDALTAAERFANGEISSEELAAAWAAAWDAARAAARDAARDAAWDAARDAAWAAQKQMIRDLGNPFADEKVATQAAKKSRKKVVVE